MEKPHRIQRKRTKGWRMPVGAVCVTRPGPFGNPFTVAGYLEIWNPKATKEQASRGCVGAFRDWLTERIDPRAKEMYCRLPELRGKVLACWCPLGSWCHADVLLELANRAINPEG